MCPGAVRYRVTTKATTRLWGSSLQPKSSLRERFSIEINDVLAGEQLVVVLCTVSAQRRGQHWSSPEVHVWRVVNGRAVEFREYQGDQQTEDEFWSR